MHGKNDTLFFIMEGNKWGVPSRPMCHLAPPSPMSDFFIPLSRKPFASFLNLKVVGLGAFNRLTEWALDEIRTFLLQLLLINFNEKIHLSRRIRQIISDIV